ncbi:MAG TPA: bifunctional diguanylate cyclase/phosphodiesterase [Mycobacteriales bacterium]|nr:bifunctional diguanylate cyclase/phosphodiesterase [Mycobacteriales bacterium]
MQAPTGVADARLMGLPSRQVAGASTTRRLFVIYAVVSLVPVLLLGTVLLALTHRQATQRGLAEGASEARLAARASVAPDLRDQPVTRDLLPSEERALDRTVAQAAHNGVMLRVRVRDLTGKVVYSPEHLGIGSFDEDAATAARGSTVTRLTWLNFDAVDAGAHIALGPRVVEAYTPILSAQSSRPIGVLEVYLPYAPIQRDIASGQQMLAVALMVGLLVLWIALLGVSASLSRRLRRQADANAYLARHDTLTGRPNRAQFTECAERAVAAATQPRPAAIAVIDLDRFKEINDTLGHANGDRLLVALAERLSGCVRDEDTLARLGGDEFGVVLSGVHGPSEAVEVLSRIRAALTDPFVIDDLPLTVEASVGFALAPQDGADIGTLLTRADLAMYVAKRQHHGVVHYQPEHDQYDATTLTLIAELGHAIRDDQLVLHFQPKVDVRSGRVKAVEALVRWQHPVRGLLYPGAFLPAAEQTELVEPLTRWVLRTAVRTLPAIDPTGELGVAVNISARSLARATFADEVIEVVADSGVSPERVILEVTETALLSDPPRAAATLTALSEAGFRISIDDFGAGQTSLGYLAKLPVSELKIDKAFVLAMAGDARNAAIVRSVIELGHSLGFTVTAEGVETPDVLAGLVAADCDLLQGYLLGRPSDAEAVVGLLNLELRSLLSRADVS